MEIKDIPKKETDTQAEIGHNCARPSQKEVREQAIKQILADLEVSDENQEMHTMQGDKGSGC